MPLRETDRDPGSSPRHAPADPALAGHPTVDLLAAVLADSEGRSAGDRQRLAAWAGRAAAHLGLDPDEQRMVRVAALLHDVGRLAPRGGPDGRTSTARAEDGWGFLRALPGLERAALLVLHHRERFDGGGQPGGLQGEEIPLGSRIVAVARAAGALLREGHPGAGRGPGEAAALLKAEAGAALDPRVVEAFVQTAPPTRTEPETPLAVAV
jgi:HD-GYP domain-containing protein (c-di-GMP phosphodiesterase class II)